MKELLPHFGAAQSPERSQKSDPQIHLEFGIHEFSVPGFDNTHQLKKAIEGDLTAHYWNPQVAERISHYKPDAVCSDSLIQPWDIEGGNPLGYDEKFMTWFTLPASPQHLNGTNQIYAIAGDWLDSASFDAKQHVYNSAKAYLKEDIGTITLGFAVAVAASKTLSHSPNKLTRRNFLKRAGLYTAETTSAVLVSTPIIRWLSALGGSYTSESDLHSFASNVTNLLPHRFSKATWVDGRTALLIAKAKDASSYLPDSVQDISVVMGAPHMFGAKKLEKDEGARAHAIRAYVKDVSDLLRHSDPSLGSDDLKKLAPDFFSQTGIYTVEQRDTVGNETPKIETYKTFHSEEVRRALLEL